MLPFGLSSSSFSSLMQQCTSLLPSPVLPLVFLGLCLLSALLFRQWHQSQSLQLPTPPPKGGAALYPLAWVYRDGDEWWGGLKAIQRDTTPTAYYKPLREFLDGTFEEAEEEAAGREMKEENGAAAHSCPSTSSFVIYCLDFETQSVVFMEMEEGAELMEEPFLDRGVRRLAGKHVLVASFDTVEDYLQEKQAEQQQQQGGEKKEHLLWVWNTGRCGSTLLHRLLLATGRVCSLSESYWCEQLGRARASQEVNDATIRRLLHLCLLTDVHLLRQVSQCPSLPSSPSSSAPSLPHICSLNMKGMGHHLLDLALAEFPPSSSFTSKHLYLYRDVVPVVESLASVYHTASSPLIRACLWAFPLWTLDLVTPYRSKRLQGWMDEGKLELAALGRVGRWGVARELALAWLDSVCTWLEVMEGTEGGEGGKKEEAVERAVLIMKDFVDPTRREEMVRRVSGFVFGEGVEEAVEKGVIDREKCLAVFGRHSQQGSRMQQSSNVTGKKFFSEGGQIQLRALLSSVPDWRVRTMRLPHGLLEEGKKEEEEEAGIGEEEEMKSAAEEEEEEDEEGRVKNGEDVTQ